MKRVCFFEFWNVNPHLETSFELAKRHLDAGDTVYYFFCGHDVPYKELITDSSALYVLRQCTPEHRCVRLIKHPNLHYFGRVRMPWVKWAPPNDLRHDVTLRELQEIDYKGSEIGLAAVSSLTFITRSSSPSVAAHAELVGRMLRSGVLVYEYALRALRKLQPDLVYIFNGRFVNYRSVMNAAKQCAVPLLIHERGANKNRFVARPFMPHDFSRIQDEMLDAWGREQSSGEAADIAARYFRERRNGAEQGWKSFVRDQRRGHLPALPSGRRLVAYFSSSDDEYKSVGDIVKWVRWPSQVAALQDLASLCGEIEDVTLVVRVHPHTAEKSIADKRFWEELFRGSGVIVIGARDAVDTYALIERADLVVTCGSTVGIEAVYWGTPSVCLGPSLYDRLDAVHIPCNVTELRGLLLSPALDVHPEKTLPFGFYHATFGEQFRFYEPKTLLTGTFLGVDVRAHVGVCYIWRKLKSKLMSARLLLQETGGVMSALRRKIGWRRG